MALKRGGFVVSLERSGLVMKGAFETVISESRGLAPLGYPGS
jgi:hypothetical protein